MSQYEKHPDGAQEEAQDKRKAEGVERGVVVVEHPRLGHIVLDAGIEQGGGGQGDEQEGGVGREDVAQEEDVRLPAAEELPEQSGQREDNEDGEEPRVAHAEEVDELRDGVVGHDALQEVALVCPPHRVLVVCQLHPDAVDGVLGE